MGAFLASRAFIMSLSTKKYSALILAALAAAVSQAAGVPLRDGVLPALSKSKVVGNVDPNQKLTIGIGLQPRHLAELEAFADSVSDPSSPNFRQFMTPEQVGLNFGASVTDQTNLVNYLKSKGFTIDLVAPSGAGIIATAKISQIQTAFGTTLKMFQGPNPEGKTVTYRANTTALTLPSNIANVVTSVSGVESYTRPKPMADTQLIVPDVARTLYNIDPFYGSGVGQNYGQGITIGISNWDGYRLNNLPSYITTFGLPTPPAGPGSNVKVVVVGFPSGPNPPAGEGDLDIQMELGMAPLAKILIYDGYDLLPTLIKEESDNKASIISESYGWFLTTNAANAAHNLHLMMSAQGQTYFASSGDSGTASNNPYYYPGIDSEVSMIGGTISTVDDVTGVRTAADVGWSDGGGGWSTNSAGLNVRPKWQKGPGVINVNKRLTPDFSAIAWGDPGGCVGIYYNNDAGGTVPTPTLLGIGGTSVSSPLLAGQVGIMLGRLAFRTGDPNPRIGRMNNAIYAVKDKSLYFTDILQGNNGTLPNGQPSFAHPGWDAVTGWGVPHWDKIFRLFHLGPPTPILAFQAREFMPNNGAYGSAAAIASQDGTTFNVSSSQIAKFGPAAGVEAQFNISVPDDSPAIWMEFVTSGSTVGGTNFIWLLNNDTGEWDNIGAVPLGANGSTTVTKLNLNVDDFATGGKYIDSSGVATVRIRGHYPVKFAGPTPPNFTYKVDLLRFVAQYQGTD